MNLIGLVVTTAVVLDGLKAEEPFVIVEGVVGHTVELPCNVTAEVEKDKLKILAWYRGGSATAFYSRDLRSDDGSGEISSVDGQKGRYRLVESEAEDLNKLQIFNVRPTDAGMYHCNADFAFSPAHKTFIHLNIIEPPQRLWVIHENGTRVAMATANAGSNTSENIGPYYVEDTVHLFCVAFGGKPLATLSWWAEQQMLKNTSTPLSEQRVRSDLERGPLRREDHGLLLTCMANNNENTPPLTIDVVIDMHLPPELVSVHSLSASGVTSAATAVNGRVRAGQVIALQCRVLGARPTPTIMWRLNDSPLAKLEQNITMKPAQRLVVSEIQVTLDRSYDESHVTCCVPANNRGGEQYVCAQSLPLSVLYPPALEIVIDGELENNTLAVVKGSDVVLNCSYQANPSVYQVFWCHAERGGTIKLNNFHYGDFIEIEKKYQLFQRKVQCPLDTKEDDIITDNGEASIRPTFELKNVSEKDAGEYACGASNDEGSTYSEPVIIDITYPAFCEDESVIEYGIGENESVNITCKVKGNPEPSGYRWVFVNEAVNATTFRNSQPHSTLDSEESTLLYERPNGTAFSTIFCWGQNGVIGMSLPHTPCTFLVTDETVPRPPTDCAAAKAALGDITVACEQGHDGGLQQKFKFTVKSLESDDQLVSIVSLEPKFIVQEPKAEKYKFVIVAVNDKGESKAVEIDQDSIIDENAGRPMPPNTVTNITTLALALCGGVALVALAACGLVLCAHERGSRLDLPRGLADPPLCAYNTEESNCETCHDSDDNSDCNLRRTESFRRAVSRYPSKNVEVQRSSSFHSARHLHDMPESDPFQYKDTLRHSTNCRVHSLQNISRKREMDSLCNHLVMHLPPEPNYHVPKPVRASHELHFNGNATANCMNTFYTMPRKVRSKIPKQFNDDASEITQNSDGFSLPPPPDEFGTYRAATKIKDVPSKSMPTYTTIRKSPGKEPANKFNNVIISPMNTVGLPTINGAHSSLYTYPDDNHQVNTNPFEDSP